MAHFVFDPPLRLARDFTVRTLDDAAEFARTYVGPRLPRRRDRLVRVIEEVSGEASGRAAAHMFRAWAKPNLPTRGVGDRRTRRRLRREYRQIVP
jgi:hypothetical protein